MALDSHEVLSWAKSKLEIGTLVPILVTTVTFVGRRYYGAYFEFYGLPGDAIDASVWDNLTISMAVAILSLLLMAAVYYNSREPDDGRFATALRQNVPLLVIIGLVVVVALQIYWSNVEIVSSWLSSLLSNPELLEDNRTITARVESFLRWMIIVAPVPLAGAVVIFLSLRRWSFSRYLMSRSAGVRISVVLAYLLLVLRVCSIWGTATAFGEFVGVLAKPDVSVTLSDGDEFQRGKALFLVARNAEASYVCERSSGKESVVSAWSIPHASIRYMRVGHRPSQWNTLAKYLSSSR